MLPKVFVTGNRECEVPGCQRVDRRVHISTLCFRITADPSYLPREGQA